MYLNMFSHYDSKTQVRLSYLVEKCNQKDEGLERECYASTVIVFAQILSSAGVPVRQFPIVLL